MTKPDAVKAFNMLMDKSDEIGLRSIAFDKYGLYPSDERWRITFRARIHPEEVTKFEYIVLEQVTRFLEGK